MRVVYSLWLARGFRLAIVVGLLTAAWHSWGVFSRYEAEQASWLKTRLLYECAARLKDDDLKARATVFGTVNMKGVCSFDGEDRWVSLSEIADVRNGTMKFETSWKPFDKEGTFVTGVIGMLGTIFATLVVLGAVRLVQWVWGKAGS